MPISMRWCVRNVKWLFVGEPWKTDRFVWSFERHTDPFSALTPHVATTYTYLVYTLPRSFRLCHLRSFTA